MRVRKRVLATSVQHLKNTIPELAWEYVPDPRDARGRRYPWEALLKSLVVGLVTATRTLRDLEDLLACLPNRARRAVGLKGLPSDTTLYTTCVSMDPRGLMVVLAHQVHRMWRSRQLEPRAELPLHLVSIDGKAIAKQAEGTHPEVQLHRNRKGGKKTHCLMALRAAHVSSDVKPALGQWVIPAGTGESKQVASFLRWLREAYGSLVGCVFLDAGLSSAANRMAASLLGVDYIGALKKNHGSLFSRTFLAFGRDGDPPGGWHLVSEERRNGRRFVRSFARIEENGFLDGDNYRELWRVRQDAYDSNGEVTRQERYFVTSLAPDRLTASQCLAAVRAHWAIENDHNWTLDTQWLEDTTSWAWKDRSLEALGVMRLIAYNIVRVLRHRRLRVGRHGPIPYRRLFQLVRDSLVVLHPLDPAPG